MFTPKRLIYFWNPKNAPESGAEEIDQKPKENVTENFQGVADYAKKARQKLAEALEDATEGMAGSIEGDFLDPNGNIQLDVLTSFINNNQENPTRAENVLAGLEGFLSPQQYSEIGERLIGSEFPTLKDKRGETMGRVVGQKVNEILQQNNPAKARWHLMVLDRFFPQSIKPTIKYILDHVPAPLLKSAVGVIAYYLPEKQARAIVLDTVREMPADEVKELAKWSIKTGVFERGQIFAAEGAGKALGFILGKNYDTRDMTDAMIKKKALEKLENMSSAELKTIMLERLVWMSKDELNGMLASFADEKYQAIKDRIYRALTF